MMESETIRCFPFETDQQGLEFVNPSERSLTHEASLVRSLVELSFPSMFDVFPIALVLRNVRNDATIPQQFPSCTRVKAAIGIKESPFIVQSTALYIFEDVL